MMTTRGFVRATRSDATWRRSRATAVTRSPREASVMSASDHVDDGEHDDPDPVDEVPVPGDEFHALGMDRPEGARPGEHGDERQQHEPDHDVEVVKPDQRVVDRPEQGGADRQQFPPDEPGHARPAARAHSGGPSGAAGYLRSHRGRRLSTTGTVSKL